MPISESKFRVDRARPGCVVFLIDQSFSMTQGIAGAPKPKIEALTTAINRFISDLIIRCERGEDKPRHYFDVGLIGYTTTQTDPPRSLIGPVLQGPLDPRTLGRELVTVVELSDSPLVIEDRMKDDGIGGVIKVKFPVWYKAPDQQKMGGTPMCEALDHVRELLAPWCAAHPTSMPPIVIHLTDGDATDGDPEPSAQRLQSLSTSVGNLMLFTCHLSSSLAPGVVFPSREDELADPYSQMLFRMSSKLPDEMRATAESLQLALAPGARGMVFNADSAQMIMLIQVGTLIQPGAEKIIAREMGGPAAAPAPAAREPVPVAELEPEAEPTPLRDFELPPELDDEGGEEVISLD